MPCIDYLLVTLELLLATFAVAVVTFRGMLVTFMTALVTFPGLLVSFVRQWLLKRRTLLYLNNYHYFHFSTGMRDDKVSAINLSGLRC